MSLIYVNIYIEEFSLQFYGSHFGSPLFSIDPFILLSRHDLPNFMLIELVLTIGLISKISIVKRSLNFKATKARLKII